MQEGEAQCVFLLESFRKGIQPLKHHTKTPCFQGNQLTQVYVENDYLK